MFQPVTSVNHNRQQFFPIIILLQDFPFQSWTCFAKNLGHNHLTN